MSGARAFRPSGYNQRREYERIRVYREYRQVAAIDRDPWNGSKIKQHAYSKYPMHWISQPFITDISTFLFQLIFLGYIERQGQYLGVKPTRYGDEIHLNTIENRGVIIIRKGPNGRFTKYVIYFQNIAEKLNHRWTLHIFPRHATFEITKSKPIYSKIIRKKLGSE